MIIEKIIVLGSELNTRKDLENYLRRCHYDVAAAPTIAAARDYLNRDNFDLIFLDLTLPDGSGADFLKEIQARPLKPLIVITASTGSVESAVECVKNGAFDYLIRPFSDEQIGVTLRKAEEFVRLVRVNRLLSHDSEENEHPMLGGSSDMENLQQLIRKVAPTNATVLIQGESGTGKEVIARALYLQSPRARAPFIKVNCAAIPENLIESEFFGHEKGAFTGAVNKREGRFELAHGGTILLDEISEISPTLQAKLTRRRQSHHQSRCPRHCHHQSQSRTKCRTQRVSPRFILPPQCRSHSRNPLARSAGRCALAEKGVRPTFQPPSRHPGQRRH
jgi:DNA-binding NtrC family response regulator